MNFEFCKYQGLGNDFVIINCVSNNFALLPLQENPSFITSICDRRYGVGADGVIFLTGTKVNNKMEYTIRIFNSDASEAEMCGNGIRCISSFIATQMFEDNLYEAAINTKAGIISTKYNNDSSITVDMGQPILDPKYIPTNLELGHRGLPEGRITIDQHVLDISSVGMGNPHLIVHLPSLNDFPFERWGSILEKHDLFPKQTNVHFVQVKNRNHLLVKVWERGCGPTLACGTGACAVLVSSYLLGLAHSEAKVELPGGLLDIKWSSPSESIYMKGPAKLVYKGQYNL